MDFRMKQRRQKKKTQSALAAALIQQQKTIRNVEMGISYPILSQSQYPHTAHAHTHVHTWQMNNQINLVIFVIIALRTTWKNQFVYYLNNLSMFLFVWASITLNGFGLDLQLFASICTTHGNRHGNFSILNNHFLVGIPATAACQCSQYAQRIVLSWKIVCFFSKLSMPTKKTFSCSSNFLRTTCLTYLGRV